MRKLTTIGISLVATLAMSSAVAFADDDDDGAGVDEPDNEPATEPRADTAEVASTGSAGDAAGWFRIDADRVGTTLWVGATHAWGGLDIASDIVVTGASAELDLGVVLTFGDLTVTPEAGITYQFATDSVANVVVPQIYTIWAKDKLYFESWIQLLIHSPFLDEGPNILHTRDFLLYAVNDTVMAGPQFELNYQLNDLDVDPMTTIDSGATDAVIGLRANIAYGRNNTLGIFIGYDLEGTAGGDDIDGRFTFIRTW